MGTHYKDLIVWRKSILLAKQIYLVTQTFPKSELYGMVSQMRRAVVSISSNIAEGQARDTFGEFAQFLAISQGSLAELETQMIVAKEIGYITQQQYDEYSPLHNEVYKMLGTLRVKIKEFKNSQLKN